MFKRDSIAPGAERVFLPATLVVLLGLALTAVTTWVSWQAEDQRLRGALERRIETHIRALEHGVATQLHQVEILRSLFAAPETVSAKAFGAFIENTGLRWEGITTLAWIPWKAAREGKIRLRHCAPAASCGTALISALAASPELRRGLEKAKSGAGTVVSAPIALASADADKSTLVIVPVFRHGVTADPRQPKGFVLGVFVIADLVELILGEQTMPSGLDLYFYQGGDDGTGQLLYYHPTRTKANSGAPLPLAELLRSRHYLRRFPVADSMWMILIRPDPGALTALGTYEPWMVLGTGLLITFLLATYIMAKLRRTARIEAIVEARTNELNATNILFNKAREQAERANSAKTGFLAAASHELRQPLQALNLFVNVLSNRDHDEKTREIVEHIGESTLALENLLNALLDISKLDAGLIVPEVEDVRVRDLFARLENQFAPLAAAKGLRLEMEPSPLVLRTDPTLIENIMRNLITNAVRYTQEGRITVRCRKRENRAALMIEDTGPGIPEDQRETVFQEFSRLDRERGTAAHGSDKGLGLGLAIVDRLVRLLGHRIEIASAPKKGSVFIVEVPLCGDPRERDTPEKAATAMNSSEARILVVDDEANVLLAMREQLENWGYSVHTARSLEQALALVSPDEPAIDLILADYRLGDGVTGDQAIRAIRSRLGSDVPGLLITGDTAPDRLREAQSSGFRFLHKPVPPAKLHRAMAEAMAADGHGA
jgi:signal transduction histidine kinase/ActR/RegA family two-component response regulator